MLLTVTGVTVKATLVSSASIVSDNACVAMLLVLSFTCTMKFVVTAAVGVPEITPPDRLKPAGSALEIIVQV